MNIKLSSCLIILSTILLYGCETYPDYDYDSVYSTSTFPNFSVYNPSDPNYNLVYPTYPLSRDPSYNSTTPIYTPTYLEDKDTSSLCIGVAESGGTCVVGR